MNHMKEDASGDKTEITRKIRSMLQMLLTEHLLLRLEILLQVLIPLIGIKPIKPTTLFTK